MAGGDGVGQHAEHLAVLAGTPAATEPSIHALASDGAARPELAKRVARKSNAAI
jgi:hypothetical protein